MLATENQKNFLSCAPLESAKTFSTTTYRPVSAQPMSSYQTTMTAAPLSTYQTTTAQPLSTYQTTTTAQPLSTYQTTTTAQPKSPYQATATAQSTIAMPKYDSSAYTFSPTGNVGAPYSLASEPRLTNVSYKPLTPDQFGGYKPWEGVFPYAGFPSFKELQVGPQQTGSSAAAPESYYYPTYGYSTTPNVGSAYPTFCQGPCQAPAAPVVGSGNYPAFAAAPQGSMVSQPPSQEDLAAYYYNYILPNQAPIYAEPAAPTLAKVSPAFSKAPSNVSLRPAAAKLPMPKANTKKKGVCGC